MSSPANQFCAHLTDKDYIYHFLDLEIYIPDLTCREPWHRPFLNWLFSEHPTTIISSVCHIHGILMDRITSKTSSFHHHIPPSYVRCFVTHSHSHVWSKKYQNPRTYLAVIPVMSHWGHYSSRTMNIPLLIGHYRALVVTKYMEIGSW